MLDLTIGGRLFAVVNMSRRTVLLDHYLQRVVGESGMDQVLPAESEGNDVYVLRLHARLIASGKACDLLAGYLLPMGKTERDWTPELAAQSAAHFGTCDTEEDRNSVNTLAMECVLDFFRQRLASLRSFLNSSDLQTVGRENQTAAP